MPHTEAMKRALLRLIAILSALACLFFAWYTVRLVWVNLFVEGAAQHRQTGMYIGAVVFPIATLLFGYISRLCWKSSYRAATVTDRQPKADSSTSS
jgi:hypothetical protein